MGEALADGVLDLLGADAEVAEVGAAALAARGSNDETFATSIARSGVVMGFVASQAAKAEAGTRARVVSLPSWELFAEQPQEYRDEVIPPSVRSRVSVEAGRVCVSEVVGRVDAGR